MVVGSTLLHIYIIVGFCRHSSPHHHISLSPPPALLFFTAWSLDRLSEAGIEPELARTQAPWLGLACMTAAVVGVGVVGRWSSRGEGWGWGW